MFWNFSLLKNDQNLFWDEKNTNSIDRKQIRIQIQLPLPLLQSLLFMHVSIMESSIYSFFRKIRQTLIVSFHRLK